MPNELPIEIDCRGVQARLGQAGLAQVGTDDLADDFVLLDCREQDEWNQVHIPGAQLLPMSQLAARLAELEPLRGQQIVVHCHHGGRSLRVANWLREQGFPKAQSMAGGIDRWAVEIDPSLSRY